MSKITTTRKERTNDGEKVSRGIQRVGSKLKKYYKIKDKRKVRQTKTNEYRWKDCVDGKKERK